MEKICIKCGEATPSEVDACVHCGALLREPLEVIEAETAPIGTQTQPITVVSLIIAWLNLIVGPTSAFVAVFSPMLPADIFRAVPFTVFFYTALVSPIVAVICLVLNAVAKRTYDSSKHAPKNRRRALLSYNISSGAVIFWMLVIIVGLCLTFYNLKVK